MINTNKKRTIIFGFGFLLLALILVIFVVYKPLQQSQDTRNQAMYEEKSGEIKLTSNSTGKVGERVTVEIQANSHLSSIYGVDFVGNIEGFENISDFKLASNENSSAFQVYHIMIDSQANPPQIKVLAIGKDVGKLFTVGETLVEDKFETIASFSFIVDKPGVVSIAPDNETTMMVPNPDFKPNSPPFFFNILDVVPKLSLDFPKPGEETAYFSAQLETNERGVPKVTPGEEKTVHVIIGNENDGTRKIGVFSFDVSIPKALVSKPTYETTLTAEEQAARNIDVLVGKVYEDGDNYKVVVQGSSAKGMDLGDFYHVGNIVFTPKENAAGDTEIPMIIEYSTRVAYASTGDTLEETDTENNVFYGDRFVLSLQYVAVPPNPDKNIADICGAGDNGQEPDGKVSTPDYACLVVQFSPLTKKQSQSADFNKDGFVNMLDYQILVAYFGIGLL